ncbi:trihelix transcription factor GT-3b-like [Iris pallida]|uniref:Trihelix transcription factor GT-3b-like n=1 Tax=Iris pallida TaxID=29817 RepID=A0AAX6FGB6_IRIPA|nr:trihelix transcription factor GT-3b-like [Iris pallida]
MVHNWARRLLILRMAGRVHFSKSFMWSSRNKQGTCSDSTCPKLVPPTPRINRRSIAEGGKQVEGSE